jgi:hypothetical protein
MEEDKKPTITVDYTFTASLEITDEIIEAAMRENIAQAHAEASFSEWEAFDLTHYSVSSLIDTIGALTVEGAE